MSVAERWVSVNGLPALPIEVAANDRVHELKVKVKQIAELDIAPFRLEIYSSRLAYDHRHDGSDEHKAPFIQCNSRR